MLPRHLGDDEPADIEPIEERTDAPVIDGSANTGEPWALTAHHRRQRAAPGRRDQDEVSDRAGPIDGLVEGISGSMPGCDDRMRARDDFAHKPIDER